MPLTPFHLGPALLLGVIAPRRLDLPTLLVASVVIDVRAALVLFGPLDGPVHGILTTFLGATGVAVALAAGVRLLPETVDRWLDPVRFGGDGDTTAVLAAALVGTYSHVLLDSMLYADARPFYPIDVNPFLAGPVGYAAVYGSCLVAGSVGVGLAIGRLCWDDDSR